MAQDKNNKYVKNSNKKNVEKKDKEKAYKNPATTGWGKVLIFVLAALMLFGGLTALIITLILQAR